jgi:hypothetical protein
MYKVPTKTRTSINLNTSVEGETIEQQITRLLNDGAPVENDKIPIYTKPSEGVVYGTDIRGDKWEKSIEISEKINADIDRIRKLKVVKKDENTEENSAENSTGTEV